MNNNDEAEVVKMPVKPAKANPKGELTDTQVRNFKNAVMTKTTATMNPVEYAQMKQLAKDFMTSGAIGSSFQNENQVMMALLAGREMGMSTMESLNDLYFVNGKLNIYGKATPAGLRRHGWRIKFHDETDDSCSATVKNVKTVEEITDTFTFEDAEKSGFVKDKYGVKVGWRPGANRKRKLRYGVLSLIIHTYLPEVIGGAVGIGEYSQDYADAAENNQRENNNASKIDRIFAENEAQDAEVKDED